MTKEALSSSGWERVLPVRAVTDSGAGIAGIHSSRNRPPCHLLSAPDGHSVGLSVMETSSHIGFSHGPFSGKNTALLPRLTGNGRGIPDAERRIGAG